MSSSSGHSPSPSVRPHWPVAGLLLLVAIAYHNSLSGPFVFDDAPAIVENPTVHRLSLATLLPPPDQGQTVGGRPLVNLSLALNYAVGGTAPRGYHVFNLFVHAGVALAWLGVLRRALSSGRMAARYARVATPLAFTAAAVWAVHPLPTEAVTYIVQRAEAMVALLCLLTLYAFQRAYDRPAAVSAATPPARWNAWPLVSFLACLAGMATKEVMVVAPVIVLLYDRVWLAASWREVWRKRWRIHGALGSTWVLLAGLVVSTGGRGGTAGLGGGDSSWDYLLIQCRAIAHYLRLTVWPAGLTFDYGLHQDTSIGGALPGAAILLTLLAVAIWRSRRAPEFALTVLGIFAVLAPSSSIVPIAVQPIAEHRMYLPAAAVIALLVLGVHRCLGGRGRGLALLTLLPLVGLTVARNTAYQTELALWNDTAAKQPVNGRAHSQFGDALLAASHVPEALAQHERAVALESAVFRPSHRSLLPDVLMGLGNAQLASGDTEHAAATFRRVVELEPQWKSGWYNYGSVLMELGRLDAAATALESALSLDPDYVSARTNLGAVRLRLGKPDLALVHFEAAARLAPDAKTETNLGVALAQLGRGSDARKAFTRALRWDPDFIPALEQLAEELAAENRPTEAAAVVAKLLAVDPNHARARAWQRQFGRSPSAPTVR